MAQRVRERPGHVLVEGTFESAPIVALLRKEPDGLLLSRGFHWINETPFSR